MMISADPAMSTATGSVSMAMETASVLADLMKEGWQPKRTVMLGLWEGAEMGHSGAMEWVEVRDLFVCLNNLKHTVMMGLRWHIVELWNG